MEDLTVLVPRCPCPPAAGHRSRDPMMAVHSPKPPVPTGSILPFFASARFPVGQKQGTGWILPEEEENRRRRGGGRTDPPCPQGGRSAPEGPGRPAPAPPGRGWETKPVSMLTID